MCIPLGDCAMPELLKNLRRAAKSADIIEIRADSIRGFSLAALLKRKTKTPLIFTCYAKVNGGAFSGTEEKRIKLLSSAISSKRFEYVTIDIPESLKISGSTKTLIDLGRRCQTKIILAYHNYRRTPDNLEAIYRTMSACHPDTVKIVAYARQFSDNFKIFKLAQKVASQKLAPPKLIAFCMGDKGVISRILYKRFGLLLTYASYKTGLETADGQIPFEQMKYLYRADSINIRTKIFGLLGNPVKHSYGPVLFNGLFRAVKFNAVYLPFAVDPGYFRKDLALIKSFLNPAGFSVTSPYKITAIKSVDRLSKSAKEIKAINTIYRKENKPSPCVRSRNRVPIISGQGLGKFVGTNTDWMGVIETLFLLRKLINTRQALVLGAGGASKAIAYALRNSGIRTTIFSRRGGKNTVPLSRLPQYCLGPKTDQIIINATPIGMFPDTGKSPVPKTCLKKGMIVFDTIYNPAETRLIKDARSKGCLAVNGLRMFLAQALRQMEYFIRNVSR